MTTNSEITRFFVCKIKNIILVKLYLALHDQAPVEESNIKKKVDGLIRIGDAYKLRLLLKDCIFDIIFTKFQYFYIL
jgi:hypothetical protein